MEMPKQRYAIGQPDFPTLRKDGALYVDKTKYIKMLLEQRFYFLSRPRRFGKSLLISMLEQYFEGHRDLFAGLAIESEEKEWKKYPVIRIDLSNGAYSLDFGLDERLKEILKKTEEYYGLEPYVARSAAARFTNLIQRLREKFDSQVVILIDEYEKPLLDTQELPHFERYRGEIRDFYSVLKDQAENIKMLFITGVTRFGHLNIFSGLNNLNDISLDERYSAICGISEDELHEYLTPGIQDFADRQGMALESAMALFKSQYDGYHFSKNLLDVYNPYSLIMALEKQEIDNVWMRSGNSTYLLRKLEEMEFDIADLDKVGTDKDTLLGVDPDYEDPVTLLYQSGYLTIKSYDSQYDVYHLGIPNKEVRTSLYRAIVPFYLGRKAKLTNNECLTLLSFIEEGEAENMMRWLQEFFSRMSYNSKLFPIHDKMRLEGDFQFVIYAILALTCDLKGLTLERSTSNGRMDLVLETSRFVYVFEFKLGESAESAIDQINSKGYALSWEADGRKVFKIGVSFSPETRTLTDFIIQ